MRNVWLMILLLTYLYAFSMISSMTKFERYISLIEGSD